ncbi:Nif3-like dinuclear metal center hexameric protein [Lapillicoccus jejuensis]|uniref:GTP cyclohydrolase 1 type 2 homolog n=1 Tax=Lapillicoccus jejuensis TaxID=402171 RepID=A0A542E5Z7_9MICO|nr:Nif3-like dinuclear metal center hexameric protein [Lapillicoccus jejuensis]TQJ10758.1 dinuclear metal center YbgI/SA1388 family protein [Lapillicoccus jejuensis]
MNGTGADGAAYTLGEVVEVVERLWPPSTAQSWDAVGLVTGDLAQPVRRVHLAVDPTLAVVAEAVEAGADLLLTHHPLLLRGIHSVATASAKGETVTRAVVGDLALYCAHTSADVAEPGVCDALARACGVLDPQPLEPWTEREPLVLGRVGELASPVTLRAFVEALAAALPATVGGLRVSGDPDAEVRRVAVVGGSGDDRFEVVRRSGADVYVTADLRHHPVLEEREQTRGGRPFLVDAGHWASESVWLEQAERQLRAELGDRVETHVSRLRTEPWTFVVGANAACDDAALDT